MSAFRLQPMSANDPKRTFKKVTGFFSDENDRMRRLYTPVTIYCSMSMRLSEIWINRKNKCQQKEAQMKFLIALSALLISGFIAASTEKASAVVYCQYIDYPVGCVARPGVVLRPRVVAPVRNQAIRETTGVGDVNRGGPVNRAGRR